MDNSFGTLLQELGNPLENFGKHGGKWHQNCFLQALECRLDLSRGGVGGLSALAVPGLSAGIS